MDWEDRIEATIRLPEYRKAYRKLVEMDRQAGESMEEWIKKATYLCKQYRLRYPIDPDTPNAAKNYLMKHGGAVQTNFHDLVFFDLRGSTSLEVKIDFTMSLYQINNEIRQLYKLLVKDAGEKAKERAKKSPNKRSKEEPNPWKVYDKVVFGNKNLNQIAKDEAKSTENPAYNNKVLAMYQRAYDGLAKAERCMKQVRDEAAAFAEQEPLRLKTIPRFDEMDKAQREILISGVHQVINDLKDEKQIPIVKICLTAKPKSTKIS